MQNALAALRLLRNASCRHRQPFCRDTFVVRYACRRFSHILLCKRPQVLGLHYAAFSGSSEASDHLQEMNASAEHLPASSIVEVPLAQEKIKHNIADTPQLPAERLNRLEHIVEQHGRSLASLASQLEERKQLLAAILQDIELLKSDPGSKVQPPSHGDDVLHSLDASASSFTNLCARSWPEWTSFLQHLKGLPFFKKSVEVEFGGCTTFDEPTIVKRTLAKFSQAYEHIFDSLSETHLRVLAEHGCPNDDRRTLASRNRLRNHFQIEEKSVDSGDSKPANAKLSDVMRLIYTIAEVGRKDDGVKLSILHLLEEIISMTSNRKQHKIVDPESLKDPGSVLQKSRREKSQMVEAKTGVEGSNPSCDVKILSQHDKWKCPSCSCMNLQSNSKCMECSFQHMEKSTSDIDSMIQKSSALSTNMIDSKVYVSGEETNGKIVSAFKKSMEMTVLNNDRQAATTEGLLDQGLAKVSRRLLATQEPEISEEDKKNLGVIDTNDLDDNSDIFDDIFDSDDTSSSKAQQNKFMTCSLSDLVRQNKKAFSSSKRETEAATGVDDYERKGVRLFSGKGYEPNDLDASTRCTTYRAKQDDLVMEAEDRDMLPRRTGGGSSMGMKHNQSYNYKAGMGRKGSFGRNFGDDRPESKGRQHYNREGYSGEGGRYSSGKNCGNKRPW